MMAAKKKTSTRTHKNKKGKREIGKRCCCYITNRAVLHTGLSTLEFLPAQDVFAQL